MTGFIVYKFTSPSGKQYIGYSGNTLEERLAVHASDRQRLITLDRTLPRFYAAWKKYPIADWKKEVIHNTLLEQEAKELEIVEIQNLKTQNTDYGYNMADGGNGGNTGRNGEEWKRKQHSEFMKQLHVNNPNQASASSKKGWENSKKRGNYEARCKQISDRTPTGKEHWNHTGIWVVRHNKYNTIVEAAQQEQLNEWTVNEYCNNPDKLFVRDCTLGKKNQSRRDCGFYRIL